MQVVLKVVPVTRVIVLSQLLRFKLDPTIFVFIEAGRGAKLT